MRPLTLITCLLLAGCSALVDGRLPKGEAADAPMDGDGGAGTDDPDAAANGNGTQGEAGAGDGGSDSGRDGGGNGSGDGGGSGNGVGDGGGGGDPNTGGPSARSQLKSCATRYHACLLDTDGWLQCFGTLDAQGQLDVPDEVFTEVGCGNAHTCGVLEDGRVRCWGSNSSGQRMAPAPADGRRFVQVAAGAEHSCALDDAGYVTCWGDDGQGQSTPPEDVRFSSLAASGEYSCAIRQADARVECWGFDSGNRLHPPDEAFVSLSMQGNYACGLRTNRTARCWGAIAYAGEPGVEGDLLFTAQDMICALDGTRLDCAPMDNGAELIYDAVRDRAWEHVFGSNLNSCYVPVEGPIVCKSHVQDESSRYDSETTVVLPD